MKSFKAVITADIVNSSLLGKAGLNSLLKSLEKQFTADGLKFGFYRGDSIHALCDVAIALKTACILRTLAIMYSTDTDSRIDIRISIGIGNIDEPVSDLGTATGEAFVLSGRGIEKLENSSIRLALHCKDEVSESGLSAISVFADYILKKLTVKQAEVIYELLKGATQVDVAKKLKKTQSTISKHAASANWNELVRLLEIYENMAEMMN